MNEQNEMHVRKEVKQMKEVVTLIPELKKTDGKVTLYEHGDFRVCVIEKDDMFDAWLAHKDYGHASYIFGWLKVQPVEPEKIYSFNDFLDLVANSLEKYEEYYWEDLEQMDAL